MRYTKTTSILALLSFLIFLACNSTQKDSKQTTDTSKSVAQDPSYDNRTRRLQMMVDSNVFQTWVKNFAQNKDSSMITNSAIIHLQSLKETIAAIEKQCKDSGRAIDGFRLYFIRYSKDEVSSVPGYYKFTQDGNFTQVSLVLVPTQNYQEIKQQGKPSTLRADDLRWSKGSILLFPIAHPRSFREGTGLCPPNCAGSFEFP